VRVDQQGKKKECLPLEKCETDARVKLDREKNISCNDIKEKKKRLTMKNKNKTLFLTNKYSTGLFVYFN